MSGGDDGKATARTVAVIVLVVLAAVALRGYLPGATPADREPEPAGAASLIPVAVMIVLALAIIALAILRQARHPARRPGAGGDLSTGPVRGTRLAPRTLAILVAVAVLWLATVLFLMRLRGWIDLPEPPTQPGTDPSPPLPAGTDTVARDEEPPTEPGGGPGVFGILAAATVALIVLSVVATVIGRRRPTDPAPVAEPADTPAPTTGSQSLARAAERGLAEVADLSRDPRAAIIACYAAMERELEKSPGAMPLDSDTPSEVLARAVQRRLLRADSATELVDLFEEARFSPHVMAEEHRDAAERVLRDVLDELEVSP